MLPSKAGVGKIPIPEWLAAVTVGATCIIIFFWQFFLSRFDLIIGDLGDARFGITILEHWLHVFHGQEPLASPLFFYPEQGILGYSESFFLYSLPYAVLRAFGMDRYLSFEITLIFLKALGFASTLLLLRRGLKAGRWPAVFGASLFALSNVYFNQAGHVQCASVAFVPLVAWLLCESANALRKKRQTASSVLAACAGVTFALLFLTSFYIAWFAMFFAGVATLVTLFPLALNEEGRAALRRTVSRARWTLLAGALAFLLALLPSALIYGRALKQTGPRALADALYFMPHPIDIVNVGPSNLLWGRLVARFIVPPDLIIGTERAAGWPPLTIATFFIGGLLYKRKIVGSEERKVFTGIALTAIILWFAQVKFLWGISAWQFVRYVVPGAGAIRATGRISLVVNLAVIAVITLGIQATWRKSKRSRWVGLTIPLSLILIIEQLNTARTHAISRAEESQRFAAIGAPPGSCSAFFAIRSKEGDPIVLQTDAMTVAEELHIPTINGYSGWNPKDWDLFTSADGATLRAARAWARKRNVSQGLCALDLSSGRWFPIEAFATVVQSIGERFYFNSREALAHTLGGWGGPEPGWGDWMVGPESELIFDLPVNQPRDLVLDAQMHAFVPPARPGFETTVFANGSHVATWRFRSGEDPVFRTARIPASVLRGVPLRIAFRNSDPRSPKETGISPDPRKLSLAIQSITIHPAAPAQ